MIKFKKLILESPDSINDWDNKIFLSWNGNDATPFIYYKDELLIAKPGQRKTHGVLLKQNLDLSLSEIDNDDKKYPGRIWVKNKYISFWKYPENNKKMIEVLKDIESALNIRIINDNNWKLEIWENETLSDELESSFIHPKDFEKSKDRKEIDHIISPMLKNKKSVQKNIGSERKPLGSKKGEIPAKTHARMRQESKIKLSEDVVANIKKVIEIELQLDSTYHSKDRKNRPNSMHISDKDIIETAEKALEEIVIGIINNEINIYDYILIKNIDTKLNIVGNLKPHGKQNLRLVLVTVMKKEIFHPKRGTKVIEV